MIDCFCYSNHTERPDNNGYNGNDNNRSSVDVDDVESTDVNNWQWLNHTDRWTHNSHWFTDSNWYITPCLHRAPSDVQNTLTEVLKLRYKILAVFKKLAY